MKYEKDIMESEKLPPLDRDPAMKSPIDWGVSTDASKVDEYIYTEPENVHKTNNLAVAMDIAEVIRSPRIKMIFVDRELLEKSTKTFKQYSDRNLSFTDAVSIEIMRELSIERYFGFDFHFDGIVQQASDGNKK